MDTKRTAGAVAGAAVAGFVGYAAPELVRAWRDVSSLVGPSPRKVRRRRLEQDADELESILEGRAETNRRTREELRRENSDVERSDERAEQHRQRKRERAAALLGPTGSGAERSRVTEARKTLGFDAYNFGRHELELGADLGILTPGERDLLNKMRMREAMGEAKLIDGL